MSVECANTPYGSDVDLTYERRLLLRELAAPRSVIIEPTNPLVAYSLLFNEMSHVSIRRRVQDEYSAAARSQRAERGYIYAFRDVRDGDPTIVKIGSTIDTKRRIGEWRRALGASQDELTLLYTVRSDNIRLAEHVLHALLFCQWLPKRVNAQTGAALLEYFRVRNLRALHLLMRAVSRHATWLTRVRLMARAEHF
jgi:hypothetical protein